MTHSVAVIIPALNEERVLEAAVASARAAGAPEIIVSDGGSSDATLDVAARCGARIVTGARTRARQMNEAARATDADILVFLHADTSLPRGACSAAQAATASGCSFGGFRIRFEEDDLRLRVVARFANVRTAITRCPWGDQAQFVTRERFATAGGFPETPIMEDYEFARRMRRMGPVALLPLTVSTSGRRYLDRGVIATVATNWKIVAAYHLGVPPEELRRLYDAR